MTGGGFGRCGGGRRGRGAGPGWGWRGDEGRRARRRRRRVSQWFAETRLDAAEGSSDDDASTLKREAELLEKELEAIKARLAEMES